ncbi:hypothetical protein QTP88_019026 [Uroleucon formosanum]
MSPCHALVQVCSTVRCDRIVGHFAGGRLATHHDMKPMPLRSPLPPAATRTAAPPGCTREDEASPASSSDTSLVSSSAFSSSPCLCNRHGLCLYYIKYWLENLSMLINSNQPYIKSPVSIFCSHVVFLVIVYNTFIILYQHSSHCAIGSIDLNFANWISLKIETFKDTLAYDDFPLKTLILSFNWSLGERLELVLL